MGVEPLIALPSRVLVAGRLQCGAARAGVRRGHGDWRVRAAWSWRTWRRALTTDFPLHMRILGRFLVKLGRIRLSQRDMAYAQEFYSFMKAGLILQYSVCLDHFKKGKLYTTIKGCVRPWKVLALHARTAG